jgi:hypothetical protein
MVCGETQELPYTCNYCGETLCSEHRLPKAHMCAGMRDAERFNRDQKLGDFADLADPDGDDDPEPGRVSKAISRLSRTLGRD